LIRALGGGSAGFAGAATPKEAMMSKVRSILKSPADGEKASAPMVQGRFRKRTHDTSSKSDGAVSPPSFAEASKSEQILKLLRRKKGASISDLQQATGWQAHSVRGFLSATVKKRMGLALQSERSEKGERRYLISGI
jgi:Protein of unknown function (DUF3489)